MAGHLFTIGHSDLRLDDFIKLLVHNNIDVLCDVRSAPYSRRSPQFNRELIKSSLAEAGIKYVFLGEELGGRPKDPNCYEGGKVNYFKQAQTPLFRSGIDRLFQGIEKYTPALMCAEKDPITCHRMILITNYLRSVNIKIDHILSNGTIETQSDSENRLLQVLKLHVASLFESNESNILDHAYEIQGKRIAFQEKNGSESYSTKSGMLAWK